MECERGLPYEKTGGEAVGAACMAARAAVSDAPSPNAPLRGMEPLNPGGNRKPVRAGIKPAPTGKPGAGL